MTKFEICINVDKELSETDQVRFVTHQLAELSQDLQRWKALMISRKLRHNGKVVGWCGVEEEGDDGEEWRR